jgi:hypothetical protein
LSPEIEVSILNTFPVIVLAPNSSHSITGFSASWFLTILEDSGLASLVFKSVGVSSLVSKFQVSLEG